MNELDFIPRLLPQWYRKNARPLPWRKDRAPYHVWISEIMLQQTRVEAVQDYYLRFLEAFPTIASLAAAPEDRLMKLWEGLGYYSRARNLQKAAKIIMEEHGGQFPETPTGILSLPGVGPYTAGAVGSICFGLPTPAVDGNVLRVVTRLTANAGIVDTDAVKKEIASLLDPLYTKENACELTQGLMEIGACVCVPNGAPKCGVCPFAEHCAAKAMERQADFPVRAEKKARKRVRKTVLLLAYEDCFALRRRPAKGLLAGLWELPNADLSATENEDGVKTAVAFAERLGVQPRQLLFKKAYTHVFTHMEWEMTCFSFVCGKAPETLTWATREELKSVYALPSAFRPFLEKPDLTEKTEQEE